MLGGVGRQGGFERGGFGYERVDVDTVRGEIEVVDGYVAALSEEGEGYGAAYAGCSASYDGGFGGEEVGWWHF